MRIRTKRHICLAVCLVSFLAVLGAIGSVEHGAMSIGGAAVVALNGLLVGSAAACKSGHLK